MCELLQYLLQYSTGVMQYSSTPAILLNSCANFSCANFSVSYFGGANRYQQIVRAQCACRPRESFGKTPTVQRTYTKLPLSFRSIDIRGRSISASNESGNVHRCIACICAGNCDGWWSQSLPKFLHVRGLQLQKCDCGFHMCMVRQRHNSSKSGFEGRLLPSLFVQLSWKAAEISVCRFGFTPRFFLFIFKFLDSARKSARSGWGWTGLLFLLLLDFFLTI